jgi:dethiobiotin synthetase
VNALAVKPFSAGATADARILAKLQSGVLGLSEVSPYPFRLPLAPAVAAELEGHSVQLGDVVRHVRRMRGRCNCLLVEGCGGLLSPLGKSFTLLELMLRCSGHVVLVSENRLGAINQVLLTVRALENAGIESIAVLLMNRKGAGRRVMKTNMAALRERLACEVLAVPDLGENASKINVLRDRSKYFKKTLARLLPSDTVCALLDAAVVGAKKKK